MEGATSLTSWHEAFEQHPIATTRAIEKQLKARISNDKGRLRALVGSNYRDLLASAEQIVHLEVQTKDAERQISLLGRKCQPPQSQLNKTRTATQAGIIAQLRLLQRCLDKAKKVLSTSDILQCAQLIVIARLLAKSLGDEKLPALGPLRDKVASLRRRLLQCTDLELANPVTGEVEVVKACSAYCLVTSSSSLDVVKHVQHLRLQRLRRLLSQDHLSHRVILDSLRYQLKSLQVLKDLSGRSLIESLGGLQKRPILEDTVLVIIDVLDLQGMKALVPEDIQSFVPYFKRTPLTSSEVHEMLDSWSREVTQVLSAGLERRLASEQDVSALLLLRQSMFQILLPIYFSIPGRDRLRRCLHAAFHKRIAELCSAFGDSLTSIVNDLTKFGSEPGVPPSLWQQELATMPLVNGGQGFLQQVRRRRLGRNAGLAKSSKSIKSWIAAAQKMRGEFAQLRQFRWSSVLEETDDEQEGDADDIVNALSHKDADSYDDCLQKSLAAAMHTCESILNRAVGNLVDQRAGAESAVSLLRAVRDSMRPLQQAFPTDCKFEGLQKTLTGLYSLISQEIVSKLALSMPKDTDLPNTSPALDNLPSPRAFQSLRHLCTIMLETGSTDTWSREAVHAVRQAISSHIFAEENKKWFIASAFDDAYLRIALDQGMLEGALTDAQIQAATDYWTRTKLLFGVLAQ